MEARQNFSYYLSIALKIILIGLFIFSTMIGQFPLNIAVLISVFLSFAPSMISRSYKIHFPVEIDSVVTFALLLDSIGRVFRLYVNVDWFDMITHFLGTLTISLIAFYLMYAFLYIKKIKLPYWAVGVFTFAIALSIGALWEIGEWQFDRLTGYNTYFNEPNSIRDMKWDVVGGLVVALVGSWYVKKRLKQ